MRKVVTFQVDDLGIEHSQYFRGYGIWGTPFTESEVGLGNNPHEALEDCLEIIACNTDVDVEDLAARIKAEYGECPNVPSVADKYADAEDIYYRIGIRWTFEGRE